MPSKIGEPRLSTNDDGVKVLVKEGVYKDADIIDFFGKASAAFQKLFKEAPSLAYEIHKGLIGPEFVAATQAWKRSLDRGTIGGPLNHARNMAESFEHAKVTALPLAIALLVSRGKVEHDVLTKVLPSLKHKPKDVLEAIAKDFPWLIPTVLDLAHMRNSELHGATIFYDIERRVTFTDEKRGDMSLTYEQLANRGGHFAMATKLIADVQFPFIARGIIEFRAKYGSDFKLEDLVRQRDLMKASSPSDEDRLMQRGLAILAHQEIQKRLK